MYFLLPKLVLEFLKILKDRKSDFNKKEKLKWVSKVFIWAEKAGEKELESVALNFQKFQNDEKFSKVVDAFNKVKEKYPFNKVFIVFPFKSKKLFKSVHRILEDEGFSPVFYDDDNIAYSGSLLENIIQKMKESIHVLVIVAPPEDKEEESEINYFPRPNVVMEFGLGIGLLGFRNVLVLWDKRIKRNTLSDYEGWPRIFLQHNCKRKLWKGQLKSNLDKWRKSFEDYI